MYCGDETGSFVGQVGSRTSRFGYGGDASPSVISHSYVGQLLAGTQGEDNDNNKAVSNNNDQKPFFVPTSCYRKAMAEANVWKTPLSGPTTTISSSNKNNSKSSLNSNNDDDDDTFWQQQPIVDPAAYLSQGGAVVDWDAYETLWQNAMETMNVRRLKHTTGELRTKKPESKQQQKQQNQQQQSGSSPGGSTATTTTTTNSTTLAGGVKSSTILYGGANPECACMHPLLAITAGFTYPSLAADGSYSVTAVKAAQRQERVKMVELFLETFDAPACFISPEPMVQAFSQGRSTALVVDVGAGGTRVTPVVDGLILNTAQRRTGRGTDWLVNTAWQALQPVTPLRPRYQLQAGNVVADASLAKRGIFHRWAMHDLLWEMTSTVCTLSSSSGASSSNKKPLFASQHRSKPSSAAKGKDSSAMDEDEDGNNEDEEKGKSKSSPQGKSDGEDNDEDGSGGDEEEEDEDEDDDDPMQVEEPVSSSFNVTYELPDGTLIDLTTPVGRDLTRLPEAYFMDALPFVVTPQSSILNQHHSLTDMPLDRLIQNSLLAVADVDVRKDLAANILLVGGGCLGLEERLSWQLRQLLPGKPKVLASAHEIERTAAGWIGGSILSSLGSFQQLWLGRTEYEEYGATLALQRFPV